MATKKTDATKASKTKKTTTATKKTTPKKTCAKKACTKKVTEPAEEKVPAVLKLIKNDKYLAEYADAINGRHQSALNKIAELTNNGETTLSEFATGYLYFGLHKEGKNWVIREWAPNATAIYLIGDFNGWKEDGHYAFKKMNGTGNWELTLPEKALPTRTRSAKPFMQR